VSRTSSGFARRWRSTVASPCSTGRQFREALLRDAGRAGYRVVSEVTDLPDHFLVFIVPRRARGK
jgi:hypothetical protein